MPKLKEQSETKKGLSVTKKRIYIAIIVVGNAVAFYLIFSSLFGQTRRAPPSPQGISPSSTERQFIGGESFKRFIDQLSIDLNILNDTRFKLLRSLGIEVKTPASGRDNPFLPF